MRATGPSDPRTRRSQRRGRASRSSQPPGNCGGPTSAAQVARRELEAIQQRASPRGIDARAADPAEEIERRFAGHVAVEARLAGQIADARAGLETARLTVVAENRRPPGRGPHEIEQDA